MPYSHRTASKAATVSAYLRALGFLTILSASAGWAVGQESTDALRKAAASGDEKSRVAAIDKLAAMGPGAKDAVGDLVEQLSDESARVRAHAAYALGMIGPHAGDAGDALAKAVADPDVHVRREAIQAIETIRVGVDVVGAALAGALGDPEPAVQVAALDTLVDLGQPAVPVLAGALDNPKTRYWAALGLVEFGPQAKGAVDALIKALADDRPEVRREVLIALAEIGPDAAPAAPAVTKLLADKDPLVHNPAAFALGRMGPAAADSVDALREKMSSDDPLLPTICAYALAKIEPNDKAAHQRATKLLLAKLHDKDPRVQSAAVRGLLELDTPPEKLAPELTRCIVECEQSMVPEMLNVLAASGEAGIPALIAALERPCARGQAAIALERLGPKAKAAVPQLIVALSDEDPEVRREVLYALGEIIQNSGPVDPAIIAKLDDPDMRVRTTAAYALGRAGPAANSAVPRLRRAVESSDPMVRVVSAWALAHIAPSDKQVVVEILPVLMHGTKNNNPMMRRGSAVALGMLGKAANPAVPSLRALAKDPDKTVRIAALEALEKIGAIDIKPRSVPVKKR